MGLNLKRLLDCVGFDGWVGNAGLFGKRVPSIVVSRGRSDEGSSGEMIRELSYQKKCVTRYRKREMVSFLCEYFSLNFQTADLLCLQMGLCA